MEEKIIAELQTLFINESSGHDLFHTLRVYRTAMRIAEKIPCGRELVAFGALLHDADDPKLFCTRDYANARRILASCGVGEMRIEAVIDIIKTVSFKGTDSEHPHSIEGQIVQDADRLDAIGAIGIARAFAYGGAKGRKMYDPDEPPKLHMDEAAYRANQGTTVNHFYEKLFLLRDMLCTQAARDIAEEREAFMRAFLDEFYAEWNGEK